MWSFAQIIHLPKSNDPWCLSFFSWTGILRLTLAFKKKAWERKVLVQRQRGRQTGRKLNKKHVDSEGEKGNVGEKKAH